MAKLGTGIFSRMRLATDVAAAVLRRGPAPDVQLRLVGGPLPQCHSAGVILTCCDVGYFERFGKSLIETAKQNSPRQHLHVHVYQPTEEWKSNAHLSIRDYDGVTLSWEDGQRNPYNGLEDSEIYFAAGRFAVASFIVEYSRSATLVIDTDGVIVRCLDQPFEAFGSHDFGLILRRKRKAWTRVLAAAVLIQPTETGKEFVGSVARSLSAILARKPDFHVDQMALYYAYMLFRLTRKRPRVLSLSTSFADWEFNQDSYIWSAKGKRKLLFSDLIRRASPTA